MLKLNNLNVNVIHVFHWRINCKLFFNYVKALSNCPFVQKSKERMCWIFFFLMKNTVGMIRDFSIRKKPKKIRKLYVLSFLLVLIENENQGVLAMNK